MTQAEKAQLQSWLQTALELELATIPPYLTALLSIRLPANREAAELIRSVMVEEMLHVALVANVLVAIGGQPRFDADAVSTYPVEMTFEGETFSDREFPLDLRPFSAEAIATFLQIEMPQIPRHVTEFAKGLVVPGLTIGEFYQKIIDLLEKLARENEAALFTGDPTWQVDASYYWSGGGSITRVFDLGTAKEALQLVIDQGEGAWEAAAGKRMMNADSHFDMGHYYRFNQIACERRYRREDDPKGPPTGQPIRVNYEASYNFRPNPVADDYVGHAELAALNDMFNARYTVMLIQLQEAFSGTPKTLYTAIMDSMHELTPLAHEMMKRPYPGDELGRSACPTFEYVAFANDGFAERLQTEDVEKA